MSENFEIDHLPGRTISHKGKEYLFFSGTAYLGLPQHPDFQALMADSIHRYGTVFGSSRNGNLRLAVYEAAETKLAEMVGAPAALTLSSGMMAGQVISNWLRAQHATFMYGPSAHPALWHEPIITMPALSLADWSAQIIDQLQTVLASRTSTGPVAILINSIDAVRSEYYNFDWVANLPDDYPIVLIVDDSHGIGVLNNGHGIWPEIAQKLKTSQIRLLVTTSLAKAMGLPGGAIFGDTDLIKAIRQTAFFGACSPMIPASLDAYLKADALYAEGHKRLQRNVRLAEALLLPNGLFRHAEGYPVFFTERDDLYPYLLDNGVFIYSFAYPTAADRANTRIVISAFHEPADIERLAELVDKFNRRGRKE